MPSLVSFIARLQDPMLRNAQAGTAFGGDGKRGRIDLGGMLAWPHGDSDVFRSILAHPRLIPYVQEVLACRVEFLPVVWIIFGFVCTCS